MSEVYQQKEWELDSLIDNLSSIEHTYKEYKKEVENLNKSLREQRHFYLEKLQQKENIIKEVREYIKNHREAVDERAGHIIYILKDDFDEEDILKILDKVGSDKE